MLVLVIIFVVTAVVVYAIWAVKPKRVKFGLCSGKITLLDFEADADSQSPEPGAIPPSAPQAGSSCTCLRGRGLSAEPREAAQVLAHGMSAALTGSAVFLAIALVVALVMAGRRQTEPTVADAAGPMSTSDIGNLLDNSASQQG